MSAAKQHVRLQDIFGVFPDLHIGDYIMRNMREDDSEEYLKYHSHVEVSRFITEECLPRDTVQAQAEIRYNRELYTYRHSVYWGIAEKYTDRLIGSCGFNYWNKDHRRAEISYDLSREYWGQGIASKAVNAAIAFGFDRMGLNRIEATVPTDNARSLTLLHRFGFREEGILRQQKWLNGAFSDMLIFSLLKGDVDTQAIDPEQLRLPAPHHP